MLFHENYEMLFAILFSLHAQNHSNTHDDVQCMMLLCHYRHSFQSFAILNVSSAIHNNALTFLLYFFSEITRLIQNDFPSVDSNFILCDALYYLVKLTDSMPFPIGFTFNTINNQFFLFCFFSCFTNTVTCTLIQVLFMVVFSVRSYGIYNIFFCLIEIKSKKKEICNQLNKEFAMVVFFVINQ